MLAPYSTQETRGRLYKEPIDYLCGAFEKDRDRIIRSRAFRRLEHKAQVVMSNIGDHYRNRLTHSLEVSSIARNISGSLGANQVLSECISLLHDVGHPPFGHHGEWALSTCMQEFGGFCHNTNAIKILTDTECSYPWFRGFNLTWEILEGIAKHNGPLVHNVNKVILQYNSKHDLDLTRYPSIEAQISAIADDVAYVAHDLEDGLNGGILTLDTLRTAEDLMPFLQDLWDLPMQQIACQLGERIILFLTHDIVNTTKQNIKRYNINCAEDIRNLNHPIVTFSDSVVFIVSNIKNFLRREFYYSTYVAKNAWRSKRVITELFSVYLNNPFCLSMKWQKMMEAKETQESKAAVVADYISGMTDRYAIKQFKIFCKIDFEDVI